MVLPTIFTRHHPDFIRLLRGVRGAQGHPKTEREGRSTVLSNTGSPLRQLPSRHGLSFRLAQHPTGGKEFGPGGSDHRRAALPLRRHTLPSWC